MEDHAVERETLAKFLNDFGRTVTGVEQRFVPLGEDLGRIVRHLQELAQTAGDGFEAIRQEVSGGALGELDGRAQAMLEDACIRIAARSVGGGFGRKLIFHTGTGEVLMKRHRMP